MKDFLLKNLQLLKADVVKYQAAIVLTLGLLFSISVVSQGFIYLGKTVSHRGIVLSRSNDAGRAIGTTMGTRWWNSNHFAPYGNIYFRLAHSFATLTPSMTPELDLGQLETVEMEHHWALLLTSYFSMIGIVVVTLYATGVSWIWIPLLTGTGLLLAFLNPVYLHYLFMAHPDHLLMLSVLIATFATALWVEDRSSKNFMWMCFWWGLGFAIKRSLVIYTPAFFFLFAWPWKKLASIKNFFVFVGLMFFFYLIVGFPQNFSFYKHISFLLIESTNSMPATAESVKEYLVNFFNQFIVFVPVILIGALFFRNDTRPWKSSTKMTLSIFFALAFVPTVSRNMMSPHDHHTFAVVATGIVLFILLIDRIPVLSFRGAKFLGVIITLVATVYVSPYSKAALHQELKKELRCDKEMNEVYARSKNILDNGGLILREAFVPRDQSRTERAESHWGIKWEDFGKKPYTHLMLQREFYSRFLEPAQEWRHAKLKRDWNESFKFYPAIDGKDQFTDPQGRLWKKIYSDKCTFVIFEKQ